MYATPDGAFGDPPSMYGETQFMVNVAWMATRLDWNNETMDAPAPLIPLCDGASDISSTASVDTDNSAWSSPA